MIMVAAGDGGASLTAQSKRGAAGTALVGRGERAEKAHIYFKERVHTYKVGDGTWEELKEGKHY